MAYPVEFEVDYPERLSRWLNNPFLMWVKMVLAIPHLIILYAFGALASIVVFIASFAILFTGRYPSGLYGLVTSYLRWYARLTGYLLMLRDDYPPFSAGEEPAYPVRLSYERPEGPSRWLNNPFLMWIKLLLLVPHLIVLGLYLIVVAIVLFIAAWAILFTGRFPRGLFDIVVGWLRWSYRVQAYAPYLLTDQYPPFSGKPSAELT